MIPVNYHHLYYFWTTAKAGSIAAAKEKLFLAQPTLSLQLQELERSFGKRLLHRTHKGVSLTAEGRTVFEYCERIFPPGEKLAAEMQKGAAEQPAKLHLGIEETVPKHLGSGILEYLKKQAKEVRLCAFGGGLHDLKDRLVRHALDLLVSDVDLSLALGEDFMCRLKARIPIGFVATPRLAKACRRFPRDLKQLPLLLREPGNPVRKEVNQYFQRYRIAAKIEAEIEDTELLRRMALDGAGVAALDSVAVAADIRRGRLVWLHKKPIGIFEPIWFACSAQPKPSSKLQAAIEGLMYDFSIKT